MKIKEYDRFVCVKKIITDEGVTTFKKGYIYTSDCNLALTYQNRRIVIVEKHLKHFVKLK